MHADMGTRASSEQHSRTGPLAGLRVIEFTGIGPGPFAGMLLSDLGADVVRIDRPGTQSDPSDVVARGRRSIILDLKREVDRGTAQTLMAKADVVVEGFRPGVMERLGLGPDDALRSNPRLVYARMTGWGQTGPLAQAAGHDINYIAVTGALAAIGPCGGDPVPPLNLVGDLGGGALYLLVGVLAALLETRASGKGQVIDCAMCDGVASLMTSFYWLRQAGHWGQGRGGNFLDGGAPFYRTYACADGKHVAVGAIEPQFHRELLSGLSISATDYGPQNDSAQWPRQQELLAAVFRQKTRDQWTAQLSGSDCCVTPVLELEEAPAHPHLRERGVFTSAFGSLQPSPAPRFSRTASGIQGPPAVVGADRASVLADWAGPRTMGHSLP